MASRSRKSAGPGTAATKQPAEAPDPVATAARDPAVVTETPPHPHAGDLRKRDLLDAVIASSGVHKKHAKPVVEAMMHTLGTAIAEGRTIDLQPMGKIKPQRTKDGPGARVVIAKIRQNKAAAPAAATGHEETKEAVADDEKER
jgi:DNA-binding protein HU-alpha